MVARQGDRITEKSSTMSESRDGQCSQAGTDGGETKMGRGHFFLARAAVPQHVKAVLNRLESGAVF